MSALTPDCDPDLSRGGSSVGGTPGPRVRSTLILLAVVGAASSIAFGGATPAAVAFLAGGVALVCAWVLARRGARLAHRAVSGIAARTPWTARSSRPVTTAPAG